jgi:hypothetical protein
MKFQGIPESHVSLCPVPDRIVCSTPLRNSPNRHRFGNPRGPRPVAGR